MAGTTMATRAGASTTGRDNLTVVAARSVPTTKFHPLPTPPNSISPSLPPYGMRAYETRHSALPSAAIPAHLEVDSDLDLQGGGSGGGHVETEDVGNPGLDTAGAITATLLAKHHLPHILLAHGPLAIRHITGYLTTSVPGFSGIPPAKARRMVVAALEGRGVGADEGPHGEVKFEKVGWGRWNAKAARPRRGESPPVSRGAASYTFGVPIAKTAEWAFDRTRLHPGTSSWAGNSATFSHDDEDITMLEDEADKMSMDGSCSSSDAPPAEAEDEIMDDDPADMTDDEDWAAVGAAALRAASGGARSVSTSLATMGAARNGGISSFGSGGGAPNLLAKSVPLPPHIHSKQQHTTTTTTGYTTNHALGLGASNSQERDAVEALLSLGSV